MNDKSTFYLALTIILIFLFGSLRDITIEFIKSSNLPETPVQSESINPFQSPFPMFRYSIPQQEESPKGVPLNPNGLYES